MRRRALIALLAFGTLTGYASGFTSLYRWHRYGSPHGGHCRHGQSYNSGYQDNTHRSWAPPSGPQAQAPTTDAPAEPGPR